MTAREANLKVGTRIAWTDTYAREAFGYAPELNRQRRGSIVGWWTSDRAMVKWENGGISDERVEDIHAVD